MGGETGDAMEAGASGAGYFVRRESEQDVVGSHTEQHCVDIVITSVSSSYHNTQDKRRIYIEIHTEYSN